VAPATPTAGLGVFDHPQIGRGVVEPPPWPRGWSGYPQKPKKKKKKTKNGFWPFGGGRTTPKGLGVDSATPKGRYGVAEATPRPLGVVRPPPKGQNPFFVFFFWGGGGLLGVAGPPPWPWGPQTGHPQMAKTHSSFIYLFYFFGLLGVAGLPLWPWGWFDHPQTGRGGGSSHPLAKNGVAGPPHFWPSHPPISFLPLFFFFFFFFNF
jgi:hypothetical protein